MSASEPSISQLDSIVESLRSAERGIFCRIFDVSVSEAHLIVPDTMRRWVEEQFGSVDAVTSQKIVKVTNLVTMEGAIFNPLRIKRPAEVKEEAGAVAQFLEETATDPFNEPEKSTPEEPFGRIRGKRSITAANVAKYDIFHSVVISPEHNPLAFSEEQVIDYIDTGLEWAKKAHSEDPSAKYFFFMWNCLWRAGASLAHGHTQVSLGRHRHYAKIDKLRRDALAYRAQYSASYFEDLYKAHLSLGCGFEKQGIRILAYLAPIKDNEIVIMADSLGRSLKERIYEALACFRDKVGVGSFNLALCMPPLGRVEEDWGGFPVIVRIVDRGDLASRHSDIASMELYAASVVASDPFNLTRSLKQSML